MKVFARIVFLCLLLTIGSPFVSNLLASPWVEPDALTCHSLSIEGLKPFETSRMKRILRALRSPSEDRFSAAFIEDALWTIFQELANEGYDHASIKVLLYDGLKCVLDEYFCDQREILLPKDRTGTALKFLVKVGPQNYFARLKIRGITCLSRREQIQNFYPFFGIYLLASERFYTPKVLEGGIQRLKLQLQQRGFFEADLRERTIEHLGRAYGVTLDFEEGRRFYVRRICVEVAQEKGAIDGATPGCHEEVDQANFLDRIQGIEDLAQPVPATADFLEVQIRKLRRQCFQHGHALAEISYDLCEKIDGPEGILTTLKIKINPGPALIVGDVFFEGKRLGHFRHLEKKTSLIAGDFLNPEEVVADRSRLLKFGICHDINVTYEDTADPLVKNVVHHMQTKQQQEIYLRFGAGNYDIARLGIDWNQNNLFGLGHQGSFRAIQSFRRTNLRYNYHVPEIFGPDTSLFFHTDYLRMEESSFVRREKVVSLGCEKKLRNGIYGSLRYQWEKLTASLDSFQSPAWKNRGNVGAVKLVLERNQLNNPLYPIRGSRWKAQLELANKFFGGNSEYERLELEYARHFPLTETAFFHAALRHGIVYSFGDPKRRLPFNKQFFNGGASTIRGFGDGEASSMDEDGNIVGSTGYLLANVEVEQRILNRISAFIFSDTLGFCGNIRHYPADCCLISVGCGLSLNTFIGPLRISQAWNFNCRPTDPKNYFRFSIGFPF